MARRLSVTLLVLCVATASFAARADEPPPGAAACSGCHANSKSVETPAPRLVGRAADEIVSSMQAFRTGARPATIMDRVARGFTDDETRAIAAWYAARKD